MCSVRGSMDPLLQPVCAAVNISKWCCMQPHKAAWAYEVWESVGTLQDMTRFMTALRRMCLVALPLPVSLSKPPEYTNQRTQRVDLRITPPLPTTGTALHVVCRPCPLPTPQSHPPPTPPHPVPVVACAEPQPSCTSLDDPHTWEPETPQPSCTLVRRSCPPLGPPGHPHTSPSSPEGRRRRVRVQRKLNDLPCKGMAVQGYRGRAGAWA